MWLPNSLLLWNGKVCIPSDTDMRSFECHDASTMGHPQFVERLFRLYGLLCDSQGQILSSLDTYGTMKLSCMSSSDHPQFEGQT